MAERPSVGMPRATALWAALSDPGSALESAPLAVGATEIPAGVMQFLDGFLNGGGLLALPILGAFVAVGLIGAIIVWSAQPSVPDDDDE
jgi:hypothetical protein